MRISGVTYAARKSHVVRNTVLTVLILLFLAILAVVALSAYKGWFLLHPDRKPIEKFSSNIVPEYRDINFRGENSSIVLKGWFFQVKNSDRAVILAHSHGANRLQYGTGTLDLIKGLLGRGYNVFAFDMRNSGESGGKTSTFGYGEKEDVKAAIRYVKSQGSEHISLIGFSTGASAAIMAAAESGQVDAVVADSPYADLKSYLKENLDKWTGLPPFPFNFTLTVGLEVAGGIDMSKTTPLNAFDAETLPAVLLIHSRDDEVVPVVNSLELFRKYSGINPSAVEFWQPEGTGHADGFMKNRNEYMERVFAFLDRVYHED